MPIEKFVQDAIILWATIDPISTLLIFVALTANRPLEERKRIALRSHLYAAIVLIGSIVLGQVLLAAMGISMIAFQVAGGIILFIFAVRIVFGDIPASPGEPVDADHDIAVFPLAIPSIATPGAILAAIVLTDNHLYPLSVQFGTALITIFILALSYWIMRSSETVLRIIGKQGAAMLVRVVGLILAALSVQLIFNALASGGFLT